MTENIGPFEDLHITKLDGGYIVKHLDPAAVKFHSHAFETIEAATEFIFDNFLELEGRLDEEDDEEEACQCWSCQMERANAGISSGNLTLRFGQCRI